MNALIAPSLCMHTLLRSVNAHMHLQLSGSMAFLQVSHALSSQSAVQGVDNRQKVVLNLCQQHQIKMLAEPSNRHKTCSASLLAAVHQSWVHREGPPPRPLPYAFLPSKLATMAYQSEGCSNFI